MFASGVGWTEPAVKKRQGILRQLTASLAPTADVVRRDAKRHPFLHFLCTYVAAVQSNRFFATARVSAQSGFQFTLATLGVAPSALCLGLSLSFALRHQAGCIFGLTMPALLTLCCRLLVRVLVLLQPERLIVLDASESF